MRTKRWIPIDVMDELASYAEHINQLEDEAHDLAVAAHDQGVLTWEQIGQALGISRQAAWERFTQARLAKGRQ